MSKSNVRIEGNIENRICSTTWVDPNTGFEPQKKPIRAPKSKNNPEIKSKAKIIIEGNIQNKSCSTTCVDWKTVFEPYPNPKNSPLGPQKVKNNQNCSWVGTKQSLGITTTTTHHPLPPPPNIKSKSKILTEGNLENKSSLTTWVDPKTVFEPYLDSQHSIFRSQKGQKEPRIEKVKS